MGPGISKAGCSACFDMFAGFGFKGGSETVVNGAVEWGWECLSALKGVLISRMGLCCRCREIRDNLCLAERGVARAEGGVRGVALGKWRDGMTCWEIKGYLKGLAVFHGRLYRFDELSSPLSLCGLQPMLTGIEILKLINGPVILGGIEPGP